MATNRKYKTKADLKTELAEKNFALETEAALERVRRIALAMEKPDDLLAVSKAVFQELWHLGFEELRNTMIHTFDDKKNFFIDYDYSDATSGTVTKISYDSHPVVSNFLDKIRSSKDAILTFSLAGEELEDWKKFRLKSGQHEDSRLVEVSELHYYFYSAGEADIGMSTFTPISAGKFNVFEKFRNVFDFAYRRYSDVSRAEAQTKEALVQVALEKVRSSSLSMTESRQLHQVVKVLLEGLQSLGNTNIDALNINIFHKDSKGFDLWPATPDQSYTRNFHLPEYDHVIPNEFFQSCAEGKNFHKKCYGAKEKNEFFGYMFENSDNKYMPADRKARVMSGKAYSISAAINKHSAVLMQNYDGYIYSPEEDELLLRFGRVFEQAYTRYLDLSLAEEQAREAKKQSSLDRIRGEIASMRAIEDLKRLTPLIWKELSALKIPFSRCGIFLIDESNNRFQVYLSTPEGEPLASFDLPANTGDLTKEMMKHWKKGLVYKRFWEKEELVRWIRFLGIQGHLPDPEGYLKKSRDVESLYLFCIPFRQGILYVGNPEAFTETEINLLKEVADTFSFAYSRYEDFIKLESAKKALEQTVHELQSAQKQLIHSEKMASLGQLTAGIAHEIQNPLNFVKNFSELTKELLLEFISNNPASGEDNAEILQNLSENLDKIAYHGTRADAIVKSMLQHSRSSVGEKMSVDLNALCDEYLRLSFHGNRARNKSFNADYKTDFDPTIGEIQTMPQELSRVLLNVYNNAFDAVTEKAKKLKNIAGPADTYMPLVAVQTKRTESVVEIRIQDNGSGIAENVSDKIFQPFFTTKPPGQGTGLGLSMGYDIMKALGGSISVENSDPGGTTFLLTLPTAVID